jgi:hypothetical protein
MVMQYVLSHKNKDFYFIHKIENEVLHGYKITRYLSGMHSFYEFNAEEKIEISLNEVESSKDYRISGKVVAMKDSDYKLII